jgi:DNA-binding protein H-NS
VKGLEALKNIRRLLINDYQYLVDTIEKDLLEHEELKKEIIERQETENSLTKWVSELTNELEGLKEAQNDK